MNKKILFFISNLLLTIFYYQNAHEDKFSKSIEKLPQSLKNNKAEPLLKNAFIVEPTMSNFIEKTSQGTPISKLTVSEARKVLEDVQSTPSRKPLVESINAEFFLDAKKKVSIHIVKPLHTGLLPGVLYIHGGGWVLGSAFTHDRLIREIATQAQVAVVFVNYSRSSFNDNHYPEAINESYAALEYIVTNGAKYKIDTSHLAIAGDSSGGNIAIAVTLLAKQRKGPKIDAQLLFYPVTDAGLTTPSYKQFEQGPWLTKASMEWFWDAYAPKGFDRKNPLISPLQSTIQSLKGLPPTLIITAENDVLRDEGEQFAHKLMQAEVRVTAVRIIGAIHDFVMLDALANTNAAKIAVALATNYLKKALHPSNQGCLL